MLNSNIPQARRFWIGVWKENFATGQIQIVSGFRFFSGRRDSAAPAFILLCRAGRNHSACSRQLNCLDYSLQGFDVGSSAIPRKSSSNTFQTMLAVGSEKPRGLSSGLLVRCGATLEKAEKAPLLHPTLLKYTASGP